MKKLTVEERLALDKFAVDDDEAHIKLNKEACRACVQKPCTYCCPALLYVREENGDISFDYAGCLECGTCRIVCPQLCNGTEHMQWNYPRGSFGVIFRYG